MRFDHVTILAKSLESSRLFYRSLPEADVKPSSASGYFEVTFRDNAIGVFDTARFAEHSGIEKMGQGGAIVQFSVDDVDVYWNQIPEAYREQGSPPRKMPWGSYSAYISDPDGNVLEFYRW